VGRGREREEGGGDGSGSRGGGGCRRASRRGSVRVKVRRGGEAVDRMSMRRGGIDVLYWEGGMG